MSCYRRVGVHDREMLVEAGLMDGNEDGFLVEFPDLESPVDDVYRQGYYEDLVPNSFQRGAGIERVLSYQLAASEIPERHRLRDHNEVKSETKCPGTGNDK